MLPITKRVITACISLRFELPLHGYHKLLLRLLRDRTAPNNVERPDTSPSHTDQQKAKHLPSSEFEP